MKNKSLKTTSIVMLVFNVLGLILNIVNLAGVEALYNDPSLVMQYDKSFVVFALVFSIVMCAVTVLGGVIGIRQTSAKLCFYTGVILVGLRLVDAVLAIIVAESFVSIFSSIVGSLLLPVLFLAFAIQFKKQEESQNAVVVESVSDDSQI